MTTGRAGSTALMDRLSLYEDIGVPNNQIACRDNEILHPEFKQNYATLYQQITGVSVTDEISLINAFFMSNQNMAFSGFKSMPNRHKNLQAILNANIQIISLNRIDLASTVASFIIATDAGTWRREGGKQPHSFTFGPKYEQRTEGHLYYIVKSMQLLKSIPDAIHINYEDLCQKSFSNKQLNDFFMRDIQISNPKKPTIADHYVKNWQQFEKFINLKLKQFTSS